MKNLKINVPVGCEIDKENSTFEEIVFKRVEKSLPKTWKEAIKDKKITGYFVDLSSEVARCNIVNEENAATFPTFEEAEACVALAQLCVLRDIYNGEPLADWVDWTSVNQVKHCVYFLDEETHELTFYLVRKVLAFKTKELSNEFLENFKELIIKAKPLL